MDRRAFLQTAATTALASALGCQTLGAGSRQATPPNIVFVYTDDQAPWALGLVNPDAHTPNMDRLFQEGACLTNSFVTTPVCSPSRVGLIASRYGTEVGITDWINPKMETDIGLDPAYVTWVELLQEAGYHTGLVGKWHLGELDEHHPTRQGYDYFMGFRTGGMTVENPELEVEGEVRQYDGLTVDVLTDNALAFLRRQTLDRPFLLSVHYRSPHAPWKPVAESDAAPYDHDLALPNPDFPDLDTERVQDLMSQYLASVTGIDRNLGRILAHLDSHGFTDNTIVVFTSDHGYNIGHHGILHKGNAQWITTDTRELARDDPHRLRPNMFDTSLRVPAAIRWPNRIAPGVEVSQTTCNLDWYPTLLDMADVRVPGDVTIHGRSFLPLLEGRRVDWDNDLYGEYSQHHYTQTGLRMYRTPEWKLVRDFVRPGMDELYDLVNDPGETLNRIDNPQLGAIRASLNEKILECMTRLDDPLLP